MQMLQPDEGHALSSDRKKDLPCQWEPKLHGMRTSGSQEKLMLVDPSLHHLVTVSVWLQFVLCNRFLLYLSVRVDMLTAQLDTTHLPLFLGNKLKGSVLPGCIYIAAALLAGAQAPLSSGVRCSCTKSRVFTRKVCCRWPAGLCFLDCLKNSFLL